MASGVKVADDVKNLLQEMKVNRSSDDANERLRIVVLCICDGEIKVEKMYKEKDLTCEENVYKFLQTLMKDCECKYIVYDCHYSIKETKKEDLVFIMWSCDKATTKLKMPYASSKSNIRKIASAKHEFELHCCEEITPQAFAEALAKVAKADIQTLEGLDVGLSHCQQQRHH